MTDQPQPRYRITIRDIRIDEALTVYTDNPADALEYRILGKGTVVQLHELIDGQYQPMKEDQPMATVEALKAAINALDRGSRLGIQYSAWALRNQSAEEGQPARAAFWSELGCLIAELETERDAAWQAVQDSLSRVDPPPLGDIG